MGHLLLCGERGWGGMGCQRLWQTQRSSSFSCCFALWLEQMNKRICNWYPTRCKLASYHQLLPEPHFFLLWDHGGEENHWCTSNSIVPPKTHQAKIACSYSKAAKLLKLESWQSLKVLADRAGRGEGGRVKAKAWCLPLPSTQVVAPKSYRRNAVESCCLCPSFARVGEQRMEILDDLLVGSKAGCSPFSVLFSLC